MRHAGGIRSANADISNDKAGEKARSPEDQGFLSNVNRGRVESTPKARPKGVVDGKQVNIPVLGVTAKGTEKAMSAGRRLSRFKRVGVCSRQIRCTLTLRRDDEALRC